MTNHGDDCYFFYYSTCTKGDGCPFRHCEAAMGNEVVCNLWQEGRCFRTVCKFRHMEITKNRKEIPCYWEKQPAGCQKPHCAFFHEKPRIIQGVFVPPDKSQIKAEEQIKEEPVPAPAAPLPTSANPQLRGVIKTETQEPVPSPTHPPVVINPADDDEDEDDQFSEEGEDGKVGPSPRKFPRTGDSLNFGVSTLEEIQLRKALKASMKRAGYPLQRVEASARGEKENIQSFILPSLSESRGPAVPEEAGRPKGSVAERLGRKIPSSDLRGRDGPSLSRSLAGRLGRVMDVEQPPSAPHKGLKPVKERLGLLSASTAVDRPAENNLVSKSSPQQIRIKSLEEIKQEKAAKSQSQKDSSSDVASETAKTNPINASKCVKRSARDSPVSHVKTLWAKKRRQEEKQEQNSSSKRAELPPEKAPDSKPGSQDTNKVPVKVKTLEEIRRDKAARLQAQQAEGSRGPAPEESSSRRPQLQRGRGAITQSKSPVKAERSSEVPEKPGSPPAAVQTANAVKVKTFEEIMREKRLRKQELEEQSKAPEADTDSSQKQAAGGSLKRKLAPRIRFSEPQNPPTPTETQNGQRKQVPEPRVDSPPVPPKITRTQTPTDPPPEPRETGSPEQNPESKARPKLNVRPSVVKPAVQLKPGQKKRAAVKPLNSSSAGLSKAFPAPSPPEPLGPGSPPREERREERREELQTAPDCKRGSAPDATEACSLPQSPPPKPPPPKPRRLSLASGRASSASEAADDFEQLINQFTDDHPEQDVDPGIGEDDLLRELSEMIDS